MSPVRGATIATPRLRLVPIRPDHGPALEAFVRLWEVARHTSDIPHPYPPGHGTGYAQACAHERRHGGNLMWVVEQAPGGAVIGASGLFFSDDRRAADFGYVYDPAAWGQGHATEGARALVAFAFERLGLDAISAYTALENRASARVLAKTGLRRIGNVREWAPVRGRFINWECHRMTRQEWQS